MSPVWWPGARERLVRRGLCEMEPGGVLSLDVFDTVLLRDTRPELSRLGRIARAQAAALGGAVAWSALYRARLRVQKAAYDHVRHHGRGEVSHAELLAAIARDCGLPATALPRLAEAEVDWEMGALRPDRALAAMAQRARAQGWRVVFVSDMYLPATAIARLLAAHLPDLADCRLFVSGDLGLTKRRGDLFAHVLGQLGGDGAQVLHVGDNPLADGTMAQAAGWRSVVLPRPPWWRWIHDRRDAAMRRRLARRGWLAS